MSTRTVAIIGGSYVGYRLATTLAEVLPATYQLVVVEANSHFQHLFSFPRFAVLHRGGEHKAFVPYTYALPPERGSVLHARATSLDTAANTIHLDSGKTLTYDYLALATGTRLNQPWNAEPTKKDGVAMLQHHQDRVKHANSILIVGGGAVGVQVAFDIRQLYPDKKVTVLHSRQQLMNKFHNHLHTLVSSRFEKERIDTVLGSRVVLPVGGLDPSATSVTLTDGRVLSGDLVLLCTGQTPRTEYLPASLRTADGFIRVQPTMQVAGLTNVFAVGDAADSGAPKTVRAALGQVDAVQHNILALIKGESQDKLRTFTPGPAGIHLTLGLTESVKFQNPTQERPHPVCMVEKDGSIDMNVGRVWNNFKVPEGTDFHL